jgi:hypothetical protein
MYDIMEDFGQYFAYKCAGCSQDINMFNEFYCCLDNGHNFCLKCKTQTSNCSICKSYLIKRHLIGERQCDYGQHIIEDTQWFYVETTDNTYDICNTCFNLAKQTKTKLPDGLKQIIKTPMCDQSSYGSMLDWAPIYEDKYHPASIVFVCLDKQNPHYGKYSVAYCDDELRYSIWITNDDLNTIMKFDSIKKYIIFKKY